MPFVRLDRLSLIAFMPTQNPAMRMSGIPTPSPTPRPTLIAIASDVERSELVDVVDEVAVDVILDVVFVEVDVLDIGLVVILK